MLDTPCRFRRMAFHGGSGMHALDFAVLCMGLVQFSAVAKALDIHLIPRLAFKIREPVYYGAFLAETSFCFWDSVAGGWPA